MAGSLPAKSSAAIRRRTLRCIKIDANDLPFLPLADSDKIEVGDVVLAVGNPFGIGQTVTTGIVSAKGRATMGLDYEDFIQTDAAINPGNSGGALVDIDGRLIGINTAILSHSGGNQGIGFAVPTNLARWVMESLVKNGHVERGFLGVNIQDLTPELAKGVQTRPTPTARWYRKSRRKVPPTRPGLKSGDVIVEFNGKPVTDSRHLKLQVGADDTRFVRPGENPARWREQDSRGHGQGVARRQTREDFFDHRTRPRMRYMASPSPISTSPAARNSRCRSASTGALISRSRTRLRRV